LCLTEILLFDQRGDPLPFGLTLFGNNALFLLCLAFGFGKLLFLCQDLRKSHAD
jgi:hypothetical protein